MSIFYIYATFENLGTLFRIKLDEVEKVTKLLWEAATLVPSRSQVTDLGLNLNVNFNAILAELNNHPSDINTAAYQVRTGILSEESFFF